MATAQPSVHPRPAVSLAGWPLVGWSTLVVVGLAAVMYVLAGGGVDGVRAIIRISAKTSLALFLQRVPRLVGARPVAQPGDALDARQPALPGRRRSPRRTSCT